MADIYDNLYGIKLCKAATIMTYHIYKTTYDSNMTKYNSNRYYKSPIRHSNSSDSIWHMTPMPEHI